MAAETKTHSQFNRIFPHPVVGAARPGRKYAWTAAFFGEVGDILRIGTLGRGDRIGAGCAVQTSDVDTHATPTHTFNLRAFKTGETPKVIIHESTAGQTGGLARSTKAPSVEDGVGFIVPDEGWELQLITVAAAATEAATGNVFVQLDVDPTRDGGDLTE